MHWKKKELKHHEIEDNSFNILDKKIMVSKTESLQYMNMYTMGELYINV